MSSGQGDHRLLAFTVRFAMMLGLQDSELRTLKQELERTREQLFVERQRVEKYERRELEVLQGHRREVETLHRRIKDLEDDKRELKNQMLQDSNRIHDLSSALERTKETLAGREMLLSDLQGKGEQKRRVPGMTIEICIADCVLNSQNTPRRNLRQERRRPDRLREEIARLHERENESLKKKSMQMDYDEYFSIMTNPKPLKDLADAVGVDAGVGEYSSKDAQHANVVLLTMIT
eukprot:766323-Hanusia_phi.AAC.2